MQSLLQLYLNEEEKGGKAVNLMRWRLTSFSKVRGKWHPCRRNLFRHRNRRM